MPVPFTGQARYDTPLSRVPDKRVPKWRVIFAYPNDQTCQPPCLALLYLEGRAREAVERAAVWYLWSVLQTRQPDQSHTDPLMHQKQALAPFVVGNTTLLQCYRRVVPLELQREHLQKPES